MMGKVAAAGLSAETTLASAPCRTRLAREEPLMITKADDYPVHQTPEPIAFAGADRNFYDRYFFNGYNDDASVFFAVAFGMYPQLGVIDAAFCVSVGGKQHNVRASRHSAGERLETSAGPIEIRIMEPLKKIRILLTDNESGITADLWFDARHVPVEEPRFTRRNGTRLFMDYTRMTQNGTWSGTLSMPGNEITLTTDKFYGTRDRSWGIRPVGNPESQPAIGGSLAQFFWIWAPCNFPNHISFAHTNDDANGLPWNRRAVFGGAGSESDIAEPVEVDAAEFEISYHSGTRRVRTASCDMGASGQIRYETSQFKFYMSGLGYTHPVWGHGMDHGQLQVAYDVLDLADINDNAPEHIHVQSFCSAVLSLDGAEHKGFGVFEQFLIGPHLPSGFAAMLDPAS